MLEERLVDRIQELIALSARLRSSNPDSDYGGPRSAQHGAECRAWLGAADNAICQACAPSGHPYRRMFADIRSSKPLEFVNEHVGGVGELLKNMLEDARRGLLTSVADNACAETFDDRLIMQTNISGKAGRMAQASLLRLCSRIPFERLPGRTRL